MNHDPLCTFPALDKFPDEWDEILDVGGQRSWRRRCYCEMIAKARADEREKAAQRVAEHDLGPCEDYDRSCACWRCDRHEHMRNAVAAARGEES